MNTLLLTVGRLLLALYFLIPGIMKFVSWDMHIQLMEKHEMPFVPVLLGLAGVFQIGAAILLIANRFTWIVALLLAGLVLVINVSLHDFWNYSGMEGAHEMQNFIKNIGIFAGLLVLSGHSMPECCKTKKKS
ncbi:DoxX family protein [Aliivibrio fischeri]|uniref:DoxX family protein n=1 Tax=Aliivibrio fischeri TaxID=668 RepID=UPI0012D96D28|nr:DoxX family protein [Aliivibrio fischeri]MUK70758.1 DoxX family membrane protein [Aliivibrio fischeri]MUK74964.1 DoxX family membrane protein [Aliivibrio fischeri]MUK75652.1 DoxX family membrane protein [Aliivibrio fischeri]